MIDSKQDEAVKLEADDRRERALAAVQAFNGDPSRPFDGASGERAYHRARLPILATDCDYEVVSISGVQGVRLPDQPSDPICFECGFPQSIHGEFVCLDKRDERS